MRESTGRGGCDAGQRYLSTDTQAKTKKHPKWPHTTRDSDSDLPPALTSPHPSVRRPETPRVFTREASCLFIPCAWRLGVSITIAVNPWAVKP